MLNRCSSHAPGGALVVAAILSALSALAAPALVAGCLTPAQLVASAPSIEAGLAEGCPLLTAIPVAGPYAAEACQGAEGVVAAAVTQAEQEVLAQVDGGDAGALDTASKRPLYRTVAGRRVLVGYCTPCLQAAAQRHLDAMGDGGAPLADASSVDASRDGAL